MHGHLHTHAHPRSCKHGHIYAHTLFIYTHCKERTGNIIPYLFSMENEVEGREGRKQGAVCAHQLSLLLEGEVPP